MNRAAPTTNSPFSGKSILLVILVGILVRMLIMPFFCHLDLYSEFRRIVYSINNEIYFPQLNRLVTFYIEYFFLSILMPLLKDTQLVFFLEDVSRTTSNLTDYFVFTNHPSVFRHLFIFKLPYLIFDVLTMGVVWKFFDDKEKGRLAVLFWVFNPVTLYATYFFGRYESIAIFFIAMTALFLKKRKPIWAALFLVLAINGREIYIITAPFFMLALYDENKKRVENLKTLLLPSLLLAVGVVLPLLIEKAFHLTPTFSQGTVYVDNRANSLYGMAFNWFYPLVFAYFMSLFVYISQPFKSYDYKFIVGSGIAIASYFLIGGHSAHYVAWLPLFPVLLLSYQSETRKLAFGMISFFIAWFAYRLFKGDVNLFTLFLAAPFNFDLTLFPSLPRAYTRLVGETGAIFDPKKVLNSLHTIYAASLVFLIYQMYRTKRST